VRAALVVLVTAIAVVNGCSDAGDCTEMTAVSQVVLSPKAGWTIDEFCLGDTCADELDGPAAQVLVEDDPATYAYRYMVTSPGGQRYAGNGRVTTEAYRVNGEDCPPLTANAAIVLDDDGNFTIVHPSD
jgi:hypothetical protein